MGALAGLVLLVVAVSGSLAERALRQRELERIASSLEARAQLVQDLVGALPFESTHAPELDAFADRAALAAGVRVTLIAGDGQVLGDSDVSLANLPNLENHSDRPEVLAALAGEPGRSTRRSATVKRDLFYLAIPRRGGEPGIIRLAAELSEIDAAVAELRRVLLVAGGVGLAAALGLSYWLAWAGLRPLRELRSALASLAGGDLHQRVRLRSLEELGDISDAVNQLAEQLRLRLDEVTADKERLQAVLDGMVEGVLVMDAEGRIVLANGPLRGFYGVEAEVVGRTALEAMRDSELDKLLSEALEVDAPVSRSVSVGRPVNRYLRVHAVRFPSGSGPRVGTVAVFHDVTELVQTEQMRRDFLANASHELRTPLTAIRGFAETLLNREDLPAPERRSYLEVIDRNARRLGSLVGDLLELSRIESGEVDFELGSVDIAALAASAIRDASTGIEAKALRVDRRGDDSALAWADRRAVEQILGNLLDNAVKYTEPEGHIEVTVTAAGDRVEVAVRDNGVGIPQRDIDRVFERFYRVDKARSRELGGTGLGLSIVKHLVQGLGGRICVESDVTQGSTFRFSLPSSPEPSPS